MIKKEDKCWLVTILALLWSKCGLEIKNMYLLIFHDSKYRLSIFNFTSTQSQKNKNILKLDCFDERVTFWWNRWWTFWLDPLKSNTPWIKFFRLSFWCQAPTLALTSTLTDSSHSSTTMYIMWDLQVRGTWMFTICF